MFPIAEKLRGASNFRMTVIYRMTPARKVFAHWRAQAGNPFSPLSSPVQSPRGKNDLSLIMIERTVVNEPARPLFSKAQRYRPIRIHVIFPILFEFLIKFLFSPRLEGIPFFESRVTYFLIHYVSKLLLFS